MQCVGIKYIAKYVIITIRRNLLARTHPLTLLWECLIALQTLKLIPISLQ
jgi:hypothetical protein